MSRFEQVKQVVVWELGSEPEKVTAETKFEDLEADSLDIVELIMGIEEEFAIEIRDEDAEKVTTVGELAALVERLDKA